MNEKNWAIRTVKDGAVLIHGAFYRPSEQFLAYDGSLDGKRLAFGRYQDHKYVMLWGTEHAYFGLYENCPEFWPPPGAQPDGTLPWEWWEKE